MCYVEAGVLSTAYSELNFEAAGVAGTTFTLTITVGDIKSTVSESLSYVVVNQNEAPWFELDYYTLDVYEGPVKHFAYIICDVDVLF